MKTILHIPVPVKRQQSRIFELVRKLRVIILLLPFSIQAQLDSAIALPMVGIHIGGQLPGADMADRFGLNLNAGGHFMYKTKRNWLFSIEGNYLFSKNIKEDVLSQLKTSSGYVIDNEGYPADLRINERGLIVNCMFGRVFKLLSANANSGLMIMGGAGYMQHKINLYDAQNRVAALQGDLKYGYDRLSNGINFSEFIGYLFLSDNRLLNFYFGFDFQQGLTKSVREFNYDTGKSDTEQRLDLLFGTRFGWILPLYKRKPRDFYYD